VQVYARLLNSLYSLKQILMIKISLLFNNLLIMMMMMMMMTIISQLGL
jgi:hypothetical protein